MNDNIRCDYLVIGGGAAGCIVARRLAERLPNDHIVLLEAGKSDEGDPAATDLSLLDLQDESYDWGFHATPTLKSAHAIEYARARILGGCANHNDCAFIAPTEYDLNQWESLGAAGWNSRTLAPALKRVEERLHIEPGPQGNKLSRAFIDANLELGLSEQNFRHRVTSGTGWFPLNVDGNLRQSSSIAYLHPLHNLPDNLQVLTNIEATRLLVQDQSVYGAETTRNTIFVNAEVILCAGSINTPQLLMLSGIGPSEHLTQCDIPMVTHLPGIGQNLIDHVAANVSCELRSPSPEWRLTPCESTALINVESGYDHPDVLFHFVLRLREKYVGPEQFTGIEHGIKISPNVARPKSRGSIKLASNVFSVPPKINLNYLSDADGYDRRILIAGLNYARQLTKTSALSPYIKAEIAPGELIKSDTEWLTYCLQTCETVYHPCGTCAMGDTNNPASVVTPDLKVKGLSGLRIADASVFPDMVTVNICNTVMMVAEHAAELIVRDANL